MNKVTVPWIVALGVLASCSSNASESSVTPPTVTPTATAASPVERIPVASWPLPGALGPDGALYVSNCQTARIFRVAPSGTVTRFAGAGPGGFGNGFSGDGGPALEAHFGCPYGVAFDSKGDLYVADHLNRRIRMIDLSGIVTTVAGGGSSGSFSTSDGRSATEVGLNTPTGVAVDRYDNVYFTDRDVGVVYKVDANGVITTVAGTGARGYSGDGGLATAAELDQPEDLEFDRAGNLYIADSANNRIRVVHTNGIITTVAGTGRGGASGDGGPATAANITNPDYLLFDRRGDLYFNDDTGHLVRMIDANGIITAVAGTGTRGCGGLDNGPAVDAELTFPTELTFDPHGNLLIVDGCGVLRVDPKGRITLVATLGP